MRGILDFSRPIEPKFSNNSIHEILEISLDRVERDLQGKQIEVVRHFQATQDYVYVDYDLICQAMINIFLNSLQAMESGGRISVTTLRLKNYNRVIIEDTGSGISPKNIEKVFNPFFTTRSEGTGLGLAVVSQIFEKHHCKMTLTSQPGQGTRFEIKFPLSSSLEPDPIEGKKINMGGLLVRSDSKELNK